MKLAPMTKVDSIDDRQAKTLKYLKWCLYFVNGFALLSMAYVIPALINERRDLQQGKIILEAEHEGEDSNGKGTVNYDKIRSDLASQSLKMLIIGLVISTVCSIILVIGARRSSYCCTFLPCLLLSVPVLVFVLEIQWTRNAPFRMLLLLTNCVNLSLSYAFSCLVKSIEYDEIAMKGPSS